MTLEEALSDPKWQDHKVGDTYRMVNTNGKIDDGWKIAYYPLFGTYKGDGEVKEWVDFTEPRALIERPMKDGIDFREVPIRYLEKNNVI